MKIPAAVFLMLIAFGFVLPQSPGKSGYNIHGKARQLIVTFKGKPHSLNLGEKIDAAKITDTKIIFADRKDKFTYLLIDVIGQSKLKEDDRQCGAGIESNLIWVKLDQAWKIADSNSVRYESCWLSTTSDDGFRTNGYVLMLEIDDFRNDLHTTLTYDADQPEKGFLIEKNPIKSR